MPNIIPGVRRRREAIKGKKLSNFLTHLNIISQAGSRQGE